MDMKTHTTLCSGKDEGKHGDGVAFIVDSSIKSSILDFKAISERICILHLKTRFFNTSLINTHEPMEEKEDEIKDKFY
jgi:hypothetical protein